MFTNSTSNHDQNKGVVESEENEPWKCVFVDSLRKVLQQVHPSLTARDDALDYVERLIIQVLGILLQKPYPHNRIDVEERVRTTFPTPIDKWALEDAGEVEKSKLVLPVERIYQMLQKEVRQYKPDRDVIAFIAAVLEYISADLFKLTGNYVKNIHHVEITCQDIRVAMCADKVLTDMFTHNGSENVNETDIPLEKSSYTGAIKDFIHDEKQHLRNLNMISKVFFEEINKVLSKSELESLQNMFQNLNDISDLTFSIITSFEDILEMNEDEQPPLIGSCLQEFAEELEFDVYSRFTNDIKVNVPENIIDMLSVRNRLDVLTSAGQGFREAVKYYLPKLLRYPVWHCFAYFEYIKIFLEVSNDTDDKKNLEQLEGILKPLQTEMNILLSDLPKHEKEYGTRLHGKQSYAILNEKVDEMKKTVDGFASKYSKQYCTELLREDTILVQTGGKRRAERRATLFDGMLVLSKRKRSSSTSGTTGTNSAPVEYKLKDLVFTRKVEIKDKVDTDDMKNTFEIVPREQLPFTCFVKSCEEKCLWMSDLIMLNIKCMLDRSLNSVLDSIEKLNPLQMPPVEKYRFSKPDSPSNIVFEGSTIKGATLLKLVERLTYHVYTDALFDKTFLITYRTFTTPQGLLDLLIERYYVPDMQLSNSLNAAKRKEDIKRYRKQYCQPIQFRVLNVLKRWVDSYFYDLENNNELIEKIKGFLDSIIESTENVEKSMKKWAVCIKKILGRKVKNDLIESSREMIYDFDRDPPPFEWHIIDPEKDTESAWKEWTNCKDNSIRIGWKLLVLHPVEIARQLTLVEYDMYKTVKSSELIGAAWTKDKKEDLAPNVTKIMRSTTNFALWLEKTIVETENFEERVALVNRILEIMSVLLDLNNFNGVFSIFSALQSACVFRLTFTIAKILPRLDKVWKEVNELCNHQYRKYIDKLHSINPPCVPFFGVFLTKLMHVEEGNTDFLNEHEDAIINFSKRRFITEIIGDIQRFQDQPYCLTTEMKIKEFVESIFNTYPFDDMLESEALNDLYQKSLKIEPKEPKEPLVGQKSTVRKPFLGARKWPTLNLKSPGTKLRNVSQSFKFSQMAGGKQFLPSEDLFSGFVSSPVTGLIGVSGGRKLKFNASTASLTTISSSGLVSPLREMTVFTPIYFSSDLSSNTCDSISSSSFQADYSVSCPPLPPRVNISCPIIPPRDLIPPPLPPRRDSLHIRQTSSDTSNSGSAIQFDSAPNSPLANEHHVPKSPHTPHHQKFIKQCFAFPPSFQYNNYCVSYFDNFASDAENRTDFNQFFKRNVTSDTEFNLEPVRSTKHNQLVDLEDNISNQRIMLIEPTEETLSPMASPLTPNSLINAYGGLTKFNNLISSLSPDKPALSLLPKRIIFKRSEPSVFQFNVSEK